MLYYNYTGFYQYFSEPESKLFDWNSSYWEDVVSIKLIELDEHWLNLRTSFKIPIKFNMKDVLKGILDEGNGTETTVSFDKNSDDCGTAFLNFYERPRQYLDYDFEISVTVDNE